MKLLCLVLGHKREYWTRVKCENNNAIEGIFTPWECTRCGYKSDVFHYPKAPPVEPPKGVNYTPHVTHDMRYSDSSRYDDKCFYCGLTGNDDLTKPCEKISKVFK